jgi:hypothetical protein
LSFAAALGYAIGILVFGLFMRLYRRRMIVKYMAKAKAKRLK